MYAFCDIVTFSVLTVNIIGFTENFVSHKTKLYGEPIHNYVSPTPKWHFSRQNSFEWHISMSLSLIVVGG